MDVLEHFNCLGKDTLNHYIDNKQEEDLHLEFKTIDDPNFTKDDRKNFAKALSGFANSDGGLIVWGIIAKKNEGGVDCAFEKSEIEELPKFVSKLNEYTGSLVSPIVEGVQHRSIDIGSDRGFAVSLIPASDSGPHMAKAGEDRYYKRSGSSFYKMEHFDVEDMFGRRKKPRLSLYTETVSAGSTQGGAPTVDHVEIVVGIRNEGRGIAKYPFLAVEVQTPYKTDPQGLDGNRKTGLPELPKEKGTSRWKSYGGDANKVIYPGSHLSVTKISFDVAHDAKGTQDVVIRYKIMAEDIETVQGEKAIKESDITKAIKEGQTKA